LDLTTKFNLGDTVYLVADANLGKMISMIVEKIEIEIETTNVVSMIYQVSSSEKFHNSKYYENELETYANAKTIAENELTKQKNELQYAINNL